MLVLQRMVGEQLQIGEDIVVTVLQSARGRVRFGIHAPDGTHVRRGELELLTTPSDPVPQRPPHKPK